MCGIFCSVAKRDIVKITLNGLKNLAYRGYDSAGIAGVSDGKLVICKEVGKVETLQNLVEGMHLNFHTAISQTRWATHGSPSKKNAHPHVDEKLSLAIVHNGIIENYEEIKTRLISQGVNFITETDSEVIAHLISSYYEGNLLKAVRRATKEFVGSYAIAMLHKDHPDQIVAVAHGCPLVIGIGEHETYLSSDSHSFLSYTQDVVYLNKAEMALIKPDKVELYNESHDLIERLSEKLSASAADVSKGDFEHYTLKEIFEQPKSIRSALLTRFDEEYGTAFFEDLKLETHELMSIQRILILACGTSWHAGCLASYMIEDKARIPVQVEISSEFRYKNPVVPEKTLVIAISQSGETADTLAAVRELKAKGSRILSVCNVHGSTLARESDMCLFLRSGPEIGVCSTKAFTSTVVVLSLFGLLMARMRHMGKPEGLEFIAALQKLPAQVQGVLDNAETIQAIAKTYAKYDNFFFLGRRYMYPAALEGALKLKEISYINANGYPAGEMKHGPIALINENCPTVALCGNKTTYDKLISNLMEVKARHGKIIAIAEVGQKGLESIADEIIYVPATIDELSSIPTSVVLQLLAYYIAKERGADIDQPRNLAKSVTVE